MSKMSTPEDTQSFSTALFVQLCGGEPVLYDPSCGDNIEAACWRISKTLEQRRIGRLDPSRVKPLFGSIRAVYETEARNRAQGIYRALDWFDPMDVYMKRFAIWDQGPSSSKNVLDVEDTRNIQGNNTTDINEPESSGQEVSRSLPQSNGEKTSRENGSNQTLDKETKVTKAIPNGKGIKSPILKATARKSFTPPKKSPINLASLGKKKDNPTFQETNTCSSTLVSKSNTDATKSVVAQNELASEEDPCDVCRSISPEEGNEMPYCESCNVCVHQACYGVAKVPMGPWFCSPCSMNIKPLCALCPKPGGAMKRTSDQRQWAHVNCAWWIKEVKFEIPEKMESINISNISEDRWKLGCSLCPKKHGVCIQCMVPRCTVAYHVTCALDKGLTMEIRDKQDNENGVIWVTYCKKHTFKKTPNKKKKKYPFSSPAVRKSTPRKRSLSSNVEYINEIGIDNKRSSESEGTSESSLGSGAVSSTSEDNEQPPTKRVKRSESASKRAKNTPRKILSSSESEPETPQNNLKTSDKVLYSFCPSTSSDARQKTNIEGRKTEIEQDKPQESIDKRHGKTEPSSNSSTPQKQQTLYDLPGFFASTKNAQTTPSKPGSYTQTTPTSETNKVKKSSSTRKRPISSDVKRLQTASENVDGPNGENHSSSTFVEGSSATKRLVFENQTKNLPEEQLPVLQTSTEPSTSTAIHSATNQSSMSCLDHKQTNGDHSSTWSKDKSIDQLTKFVTSHMQYLSDREAKKLERKIVWLCIKSHRNSKKRKK